MNDMTLCGNCKWFVTKETKLFGRVGDCRRLPPIAGEREMAEFPKVTEATWCGEHKAKVAA